MSYLLEDMEKWAEDRDAKADLSYLDQLYEETQAAQRKYNQGLKRAKRMGNIGLATELGGFGLTLASIQGKPSKLKAKGTMAGAGLIAGSLIPLVGSEVVKYKAIRGAQNHIDSLRNNKELQAIEREYQRAQAEQEKTAGIFDKLRKKKFPNQIRKLSNPTVYEKIQALPPDLRIKYSKDSMKFNQDRWDYVHKNVKDSDFDQEGNLNDDKYFPLVDSFNKKYGKLTPMGYVYKKQANEGIAGQEKVAMPAFNEEATRSRNFLPGVSEALEKVKEAEATKNKVLKSYNEAQPAINVLKQRFEKNQERLNRAESQEWARARLRSSGKSLNRLIKNRPVPIGPMSEAMEEDWDSTGARKNVKYWGQEYKKSLEKNPNDIKYKNHYEKQMDLSERLLERAKRKAPLTKDMISATNERSDTGKQYRLTRGAYNTKREQNLPAVPTPPKDIFLEGLQLDLKQKMRDLGQKTRKDIDQIHQEILDDFSKSRVERKQKTEQAMPNEQAMKTPFSRNKALGLGVGAGLAAVGGGAYLYNRYKKKKRAQADQEKTAGVGKTIYDSKSKLKDAAFGTYKKGPYQGDNKFNVAYGKRAVKKHYEKLFDMHTDLGEQQRKPKNATWNINGYNKSFDKKTKVGQANRSSIKHDYDDAFVEAGARPVALTALGLGVGIYGGKKLLDRYKKRQEDKKEQSYYV